LRKITKQVGFEPQSLTSWKKRINNQGKNYIGLTTTEKDDIRSACTVEQFYLCAYCCKPISGTIKDCMNEHVVARDIAPNRSLDFDNIVASCITPKQCDNAHGSQPLPLTPFDIECETDLKFKLSGRVEGMTSDAQETIRVLNLDNKSLVAQRRMFINSILFANGIDADDGLDDDELIKMVISDINNPKNGKLEAFAPIAINVLRRWVA
jgi:uncharacterized protein (TIGR02646 family)